MKQQHLKFAVCPHGLLRSSLQFAKKTKRQFAFLCQLPPDGYRDAYFRLFLLLIACCFLIISCSKNAGLGGNATLMVYAEHHGNIIINHTGHPDTVFLKYNVDEFPGSKPSDYDAFFVGTPREEFVKIEGLKTGKYFVYSVAFDSTWINTSGTMGARVTGGMPLKIKRSERDDIITIRIPLSE